MENYEETRPSFHLNSFSSTAFKSSVFDTLPDDPKKHFRKHIKFQSPSRELLTSRTINFLTPRTQISTLSNLNDKESMQNTENLNKLDSLRSLDSNTVLITTDEDLKTIPTLRWCAYCKRESLTEPSYKNSSKTFWSAVGIFLMGGVCGCFMLPYLTDSCKDIVMKCSKCHRELNYTDEEYI